jgi:hypothetical protein
MVFVQNTFCRPIRLHHTKIFIIPLVANAFSTLKRPYGCAEPDRLETVYSTLIHNEIIIQYTGCTLIRTHPYPYDVPLSVRFLVEMKTRISLKAYVDVYPYPYVVPLSKQFLAELRCTDKGTPSVLNYSNYFCKKISNFSKTYLSLIYKKTIRLFFHYGIVESVPGCIILKKGLHKINVVESSVLLSALPLICQQITLHFRLNTSYVFIVQKI